MNIQEIKLQINDYLDLYLYAGIMGDKLWQQETIEKLKNIVTEKIQKPTDLNKLMIRYKRINEEILTIYHQMKQQSTHHYLEEKLRELKQQRLILGRQICSAAKQNSQIM
jgi:recombinational DNA repair protein RecR